MKKSFFKNDNNSSISDEFKNAFPIHDMSDLINDRREIKDNYSITSKDYIVLHKKNIELNDIGFGKFIIELNDNNKNNGYIDIYKQIASILNIEGYKSGDKFELELRLKKIN